MEQIVAKLRKRREVAGAGLTSRMACKWLGIIDQTCWRIRSARVRRTRRAVGVGPVGVSCCVACEINLRSCLRLEENRAGRSRGLPGVYVFAVSSLRPPPRPRPIVRAMRLRATARALTRQRINARNEGVRGSSPRVGFNADLTSVRVGKPVEAGAGTWRVLQRRVGNDGACNNGSGSNQRGRGHRPE